MKKITQKKKKKLIDNNKHYIAYEEELDECKKVCTDENTGEIINTKELINCYNRARKGKNYINWMKDLDEWENKNN